MLGSKGHILDAPRGFPRVTDQRWYTRAKGFVLEVYREWSADDISTVAGALTFFGVLALFPFLVFAISLASLFVDASVAASIADRLHKVTPPAVATILSERIDALATGGSPALLTISAAGAVWAASGGANALITALNRVFDAKETRSFLKRRLTSLAATLAGAILSLFAVLAAVAGPAVAHLLPPPWDTVSRVLGYLLGLFLMSAVLAILYWALPNVRRPFRFTSWGSAFAAVAWLVASIGFSFYVRNFGNYDVTYGTLGGVIVLLIWMWISSQVILLGAEINAVLLKRKQDVRSS